MKTRHQRSPHSRLVTVLCFWWWGTNYAVMARQRRIIVDDSDPSLVYHPLSAWATAADICPTCDSGEPLHRTLAFNHTFHEVVNNVHRIGHGVAAGIAPISSSQGLPVPPDSKSSHDITLHREHSRPREQDQDDQKTQPRSDGRRDDDRSPIGARIYSSRRSDYAYASRHEPVTMQFSFTGSSVQIFCLESPGHSSRTMDLQFSINGQIRGYWNAYSTPSVARDRQLQVFGIDGLNEEPHVLLVDIGPNSAFLFDYLVYTQMVDESRIGDPLTAAQGSLNSLKARDTDEQKKKRKTATFAAAVGSSVGVLAVISLGLTISIIRRRRLARQRERHDRESDTLHTDASEDSPHMSGPAPFVPRFFPGTVPPDPPPYAEPLVRSTSASSQASSINGLSMERRPRPRGVSYADVPPSTPPPPLDDLVFSPPPPFPVAIASPLPPTATSTVQSRTTGSEDRASGTSHIPLAGSRAPTLSQPSPLTPPPPTPPGLSRPSQITSPHPIPTPLSPTDIRSPHSIPPRPPSRASSPTLLPPDELDHGQQQQQSSNP